MADSAYVGEATVVERTRETYRRGFGSGRFIFRALIERWSPAWQSRHLCDGAQLALGASIIRVPTCVGRSRSLRHRRRSWRAYHLCGSASLDRETVCHRVRPFHRAGTLARRHLASTAATGCSSIGPGLDGSTVAAQQRAILNRPQVHRRRAAHTEGIRVPRWGIPEIGGCTWLHLSTCRSSPSSVVRSHARRNQQWTKHKDKDAWPPVERKKAPNDEVLTALHRLRVGWQV